MTGTSVWIKKSVIPGECQSPAASRRKSAYESPRRSPRKQVKIGDKLPVPPLEGGNDEKSGSMTAITNDSIHQGHRHGSFMRLRSSCSLASASSLSATPATLH